MQMMGFSCWNCNDLLLFYTMLKRMTGTVQKKSKPLSLISYKSSSPADAIGNSSALFRWVLSHTVFQKHCIYILKVEAPEKPAGSWFQEAVSDKWSVLVLVLFFSSFRFFLHHFCILTWYPLRQMGSFFFFLELFRILGN